MNKTGNWVKKNWVKNWNISQILKFWSSRQKFPFLTNWPILVNNWNFGQKSRFFQIFGERWQLWSKTGNDGQKFKFWERMATGSVFVVFSLPEFITCTGELWRLGVHIFKDISFHHSGTVELYFFYNKLKPYRSRNPENFTIFFTLFLFPARVKTNLRGDNIYVFWWVEFARSCTRRGN